MVRMFYLHNFLRQLAFFSAVLVPFFTDWGGITLFQVQLLQSWFTLCIFFLEVPTGAVADYFGRKYSLAFGGIVTAAAALLYGSIPHFTAFLVSEFLFAVGAAFTSGADQALLYDTLVDAGREKESKSIFARAHTFTLIGIMVSALLGSAIAAVFGVNAPMLVSALPYGIAGCIAFTLEEPSKHQSVTESARYLVVIRSGFLFFLHHRILRRMALDAVIVAAAGYFVIWLYQPLLQSLHIPLLLFGLGHVLLTGAELFVTAAFTRMESWLGSGKRYFRITALAVAAPFFLVAVFPNIYTVGLFIIISGGFGMTRIELMASYMNRHIPTNQRATVLSAISMLRRFVQAILNPIVGFLAFRSLPLALLFVGLLPLFIVVLSPVKEDIFDADKQTV